jgi:hypothetical protein
MVAQEIIKDVGGSERIYVAPLIALTAALQLLLSRSRGQSLVLGMDG